MTEEEIAKILGSENEEFQKLKAEHKELDAQLAEYDSRVYLTPEEELERKKIQKMKLMKKDRMAELIREYKAGAAAG
jgi:uncharacterized protein YdcH (DUF465 family)